MRLLLPLVLLLPLAASAQTIPTIGTEATFDIATWNVEHFGNPGEPPSNDELQFEHVRTVLAAAEIDLWALQEMDYESDFDALVDSLGAPYEGVWVADETSFAVGYGFIYDAEIVQVQQAATVLDDFSFEFGFRPPLLLRADLTLPGGTVEDVRILNIHAKCCSDASSYNRRVAASAALKNYVDNFLLIDAPIFVLGDFNDELRSSIYNGETSPYQNFRDDDEDYRFVSYALDLANIPTSCGNDADCDSGSAIDHILLTRTVEPSFVAGSMSRFEEVLTEIPNYVSTTSDHVPVYARLDFGQLTATEDEGAPQSFALRAPFPNPARAATTLTYTLPASAVVQLEVFDALGRRAATVAEGPQPAGTHEATLRTDGFRPGLYVVRLAADGRTATRRLVVLP